MWTNSHSLCVYVGWFLGSLPSTVELGHIDRSPAKVSHAFSLPVPLWMIVHENYIKILAGGLVIWPPDMSPYPFRLG